MKIKKAHAIANTQKNTEVFLLQSYCKKRGHASTTIKE